MNNNNNISSQEQSNFGMLDIITLISCLLQLEDHSMNVQNGKDVQELRVQVNQMNQKLDRIIEILYNEDIS